MRARRSVSVLVTERAAGGAAAADVRPGEAGAGRPTGWDLQDIELLREAGVPVDEA